MRLLAFSCSVLISFCIGSQFVGKIMYQNYKLIYLEQPPNFRTLMSLFDVLLFLMVQELHWAPFYPQDLICYAKIFRFRREYINYQIIQQPFSLWDNRVWYKKRLVIISSQLKDPLAAHYLALCHILTSIHYCTLVSYCL